MTKLSIDDLLTQLSAGLKQLADDEWQDYQKAAIRDGNAFLINSTDDLTAWAEQLALKKITADDLEFLLKGKMDVAELTALKQQGLAKVRLEKFRNSMVSLVMGSLVKTLL